MKAKPDSSACILQLSKDVTERKHFFYILRIISARFEADFIEGSEIFIRKQRRSASCTTI
jgi:hypothetical protein